MNSYREQIEAAVRATVIHSATSYSWFGERSAPLSLPVRRAVAPETARSYLEFTLQNALYADFYCQGSAMAGGRRDTQVAASSATWFIEALSAANAIAEYAEDGWELQEIADGRLVVSRNALRLWVRPEDCVASYDSNTPRGTRVQLRFPKALLGISPGFFFVQSAGDAPTDEDPPVVRIYWNVAPPGAIALLRAATRKLSAARLPYKLKVVSNPARYTRCDTAVVYVLKPHYCVAAEILAPIYGEIAGHVRPATPAFTKTLAPGVAIAEDPGDGQSFGQHRCRVLADGIIRAHEQRKIAPADRLRVVVDRFADAGIDVEAPYLNRGSGDAYVGWRTTATRRSVRSAASGHESLYLRTASQIGEQLTREAIWQADRCSWMGAVPQEADRARLPGSTYTILGPELYAGTSGVALFLAELHAVTGEADARRTALAAMRYAFSRAETVPPGGRIGLYTGWVGIALVAARVAVLLGDSEPRECAARLLGQGMLESRTEAGADLLRGKAGCIIGLLVLRDLLEQPDLQERAVRSGDEILRAADREGPGYSWPAMDAPSQRNLTGFSHGTAGIAYALLELFAATGRGEYQRGAELAFEYERGCFDEQAGNWPDFRRQSSDRGHRTRSRRYATAWCHGAPGIAISRLRAYELLGDELFRTEAIRGLETTHAATEAALRSATSNFSLCHGLSGNAAALAYGGQTLPMERARDSKLADDVARLGIEEYGRPELPWPCGAGGGESPGLMLGLAGIGHFYLRLHAPAIPSLLIPRREQFLA